VVDTIDVVSDVEIEISVAISVSLFTDEIVLDSEMRVDSSVPFT
jgi:hypothetical protein